MNERVALLAIYRIGVKNEIEEVKAAGEPAAVGVLPSDASADALLWMRWDAATRDSILLYDGSGVYEKHVDDLTLSDAGEAAAFYEHAAQACFRTRDQHMFAADVKEDLEQLGGEDA
jgi:hypothetical protein